MANINFGGAQTNTSRLGDTTSDWFTAQKFTAPANGNITSVVIHFGANVGSPVDNAILIFQADNAGAPSQTNLSSDTFTPTPSAGNTVTLATPLLIAGGSTYWVLLRRAGSADGSNYRNVADDSAVATTPSRVFSQTYVDQGANPGELWMTLTYTPTIAYTLTATQGSYTLTGEAATISKYHAYSMIAAGGSYSLIGESAQFTLMPYWMNQGKSNSVFTNELKSVV